MIAMVNRLALGALVFLTACTTEHSMGDPSRAHRVTVSPVVTGHISTKIDIATGKVISSSRTVTVTPGRQYWDDGATRVRQR